MAPLVCVLRVLLILSNLSVKINVLNPEFLLFWVNSGDFKVVLLLTMRIFPVVHVPLFY